MQGDPIVGLGLDKKRPLHDPGPWAKDDPDRDLL
jgi:hypothetical protein